MKVVTVLLMFATVASVRAGEKYSDKYDAIDINLILKNERLYKRYFNCIMDRGDCTTDGRELKKTMPEAILTDCEKCTDHQKSTTEKVIKYMLEHKRADYDEMERKYDPTASYRKRHHIEA